MSLLQRAYWVVLGLALSAWLPTPAHAGHLGESALREEGLELEVVAVALVARLPCRGSPEPASYIREVSVQMGSWRIGSMRGYTMRRSMVFGILVSVSLLAGCSADSKAREGDRGAEGEGKRAAELARGAYVVVPSDAEFSSGPGAGAERWSYEAGRRWRFEVVSVDSNWVELRVPSPSEAGHHCYGVPRGVHDTRLRVYVKRDQLLPVSVRPIEASFDDDTGYSLRPGVVVSGDGTGRTAAVYGMEIPVEVSAERLGRAYRPPDGEPPGSPDRWWSVSESPVIDGESVDASNRPLPVVGHSEREGRALADISGGCGTVRAYLEAPSRVDAPNSEPPAPSEKFQVTWATPNSTMYTLDGDEAGRVGDAKWPLRVRVETREGRPCYAASFVEVATKSFDPERHFRVCFAEEDLQTPSESGSGDPAAETASDPGAVSVLETEINIRLVDLSGGLTWDDVKRPVASEKGPIEGCYREEISPEDSFAGSMRAVLSIEPDGDVAGVEAAESSLGRRRVVDCVREALGEASFPRVGSGSELTVEFEFSVREK